MGVINSAEICGNVHRKGYRKGIYKFCLDLGTFPLVSPLDSFLLGQVKERAEQKHKGELVTWIFSKIGNGQRRLAHKACGHRIIFMKVNLS